MKTIKNFINNFDSSLYEFLGDYVEEAPNIIYSLANLTITYSLIRKYYYDSSTNSYFYTLVEVNSISSITYKKSSVKIKGIVFTDKKVCQFLFNKRF